MASTRIGFSGNSRVAVCELRSRKRSTVVVCHVETTHGIDEVYLSPTCGFLLCLRGFIL
jgi:hypothetical protein